MARAGVELWAIQLLGRWGGDTVMRYVREAFLDASASWAVKVMAFGIEEKLQEKSAVSSDVVDLVATVAGAPLASDVRPCPSSKTGPLAHELHAAKAMPDCLSIVTSSKGIVHSVLIGPPDIELNKSVSICGWSFGGSRALLSSAAALPADYKSLCERCFPEGRAKRKQALAASIRPPAIVV